MNPNRKTLPGQPQPPQLDEDHFPLVRRKGHDRPTLISRQTPTDFPRACRLEVVTQIVRRRDGALVFEARPLPAPEPAQAQRDPYYLVALVWALGLGTLLWQVMR